MDGVCVTGITELDSDNEALYWCVGSFIVPSFCIAYPEIICSPKIPGDPPKLPTYLSEFEDCDDPCGRNLSVILVSLLQQVFCVTNDVCWIVFVVLISMLLIVELS